jgi:hypothetical protein
MNVTELHDALLRRELAELAGREQPPDRSAAIAERLQGRDRVAVRQGARQRRRTMVTIGLGIAATLAVAFLRPRSLPATATPAPNDSASTTVAPPTRTASALDSKSRHIGDNAADLAARRSAEAMLAAERLVAEMIAAGSLPTGDEPLPFPFLRGWNYERGLTGMPQSIRAKHGARVGMVGFMLPLDAVDNMAQFLLVESLWSCCYGVPPDIHGIVRCVMPAGRTANYSFDPAWIRGTFEVGATMEDGYCVDVYQLRVMDVVPL